MNLGESETGNVLPELPVDLLGMSGVQQLSLSSCQDALSRANEFVALHGSGLRVD